MARSNNVSFAVLLFFGITLIASPILAIENEDESTEAGYIDDENLAASPKVPPSEVTGSGKECNDALVKYAAEGQMFKANYDFYLKRGDDLYNICLAVFVD
ncbi:hypothetical protein H0E87_028661 [Populus deltoides]|uniref:Uncharacterized protein n=1 Tax=Populus deltoides TaxID=3696 RepID=A0A8T2WWE6_POPDE|nr:hypothetical protein H0E87_028661 [Populus deltoides]